MASNDIKETAYVSIGAQIERDLRDRLLEIAKDNDRSFSAELRRAIRLYLGDDEALASRKAPA